MGRGTFLVLAALSLLLGFYMYTPLPDDIEGRWTLNWFLIPTKIIHVLSDVYEYFGVGEAYVMKYRLLYLMDILTLSTPADDSEVKVTGAVFDGVNVTIYEPKSKDSSSLSPGFVYIHGGGWMFGSVAAADVYTRELARQLKIPIVSIEYRLAPKHVYPAALHDCFDATVYFIQNAKRYGVDPTRIGIGGDSSGGNLAAAVALKLRDDMILPKLKLQLLIYPVLQAFDFNTTSYQLYGNIPSVTKAWVIRAWLMYYRGNTDLFPYLFNNSHISLKMKKSKYASFVDQTLLPEHYRKESVASSNDANNMIGAMVDNFLVDPYLSPLMSPDLTNMPMTYVITAEYDLLRDDALFYVTRLQQAGVDVTHKNYKSIHGFTYFVHPSQGLTPGVIAFEDVVLFLRKNL